MATFVLDCCGLRCPQPILKIAGMVPELKAGDVLKCQQTVLHSRKMFVYGVRE